MGWGDRDQQFDFLVQISKKDFMFWNSGTETGQPI